MQPLRITKLFYYLQLFYLVSVNPDVRPKLDLKFVMEALIEQHKEPCDFEWISSGQEERLKALEKVVDALTSLIFHPGLIYDNKKYVISKIPYRNSDEAMTYCTAFGGYLAEIDNIEKYAALRNYFQYVESADVVLIAGSDATKEGTWVFQRTGASVPVLDWNVEQPDDWKNNEDCLTLGKAQNYKMNDIACNVSDPGYKFMCELPKV